MNGPQIRFQGNVVETPEIRYTRDEGRPYARARIAVNTYMGPDRDRETTYFDVMLWGNRAETLAPLAQKGRWVYVEGRLSRNDWTDEKDGAKYTSLRVNPRDFLFLEPGQPRAADVDQETPPDTAAIQEPAEAQEPGDPSLPVDDEDDDPDY